MRGRGRPENKVVRRSGGFNEKGDPNQSSKNGRWSIERQCNSIAREWAQLGAPYPTREGSIDILEAVCECRTDRDFRLLVGWMASAMMPEGAVPYPGDSRGARVGQEHTRKSCGR